MAGVLDRFTLADKSALLLGAGVLGQAIARALAEAGAKVWVGNRTAEKAAACAAELRSENLAAEAIQVDVLDHASLAAARDRIGPVDILVNAVGGNQPAATTSPERTFFDLPLEGLERVVAINLFGGAVLPCQVFGRAMAARPDGGVILNVSSMSGLRPLTRVPGYSAAKAAVGNFTQWLAVHMATEYNPNIRVNALAPGFFLTDQNRFLLTEAGSGKRTARGEQIIAHTPMRRFGAPEDLAGAVVWLCSDASAFVTGIVLPVDGGFAAFGGV